MRRLEPRNTHKEDYRGVYSLALILTFLVIFILGLALSMEPKIYLLGGA